MYGILLALAERVYYANFNRTKCDYITVITIARCIG
jgi:hypothetical protein